MLARLSFLVALGLLAAPAAAESVQAGEPASPPVAESDWQFSVQPYGWLAGLKGDMGVSSEVEPVGVDLSFFGDILGHIKFAAMTAFDARHDRFVAAGDIFYISLGASNNVEVRGVDFLEADLKSKLFFTTLTAGYRAVDQDRLFLDLLAGGRVYSMKTSLDLEGPRRSFSGSKTEVWVDPVIAARFQAPLGQDWSVRTYGDIGGFGIGSHFTWQLLGVVEYGVSSRWTLSAGWRHLDVDYDHKGFLFDAALDGPILGAVYRF